MSLSGCPKDKDSAKGSMYSYFRFGLIRKWEVSPVAFLLA